MDLSSLSRKDAKAIFWESVHEAEKSCTFPWVIDYETDLPGGHLTIHKVFMIITGVAGIINILIALHLLSGHLLYWTKPLVQKQYARVIIFIIVLSITTFLSSVFYDHSGFIEPVGQLYEGFAIAAVFLLYVQIVASEAESREAFFHELAAKESGSLAWFWRTWIFVFQILVIRIITLVALEALYGVTCPLSSDRSHGRTAITVIQSISTAIAVIWIILFERRLKNQLRSHRSLAKLWAFKIVIILQIIQELAFAGMAAAKLWIPSAPYYMSYSDFLKGLPQVLFIWELTAAALVFLWAYEFGQYQTAILQGVPAAAGPIKALLSIWNLADIWHGSVYAFSGSNQALNKVLGGFSEPRAVILNDFRMEKGMQTSNAPE